MNNIYVAFLLYIWMTIAQAQAAVAPQFGDQLAEISWQAWAIVFGYGAVGILIRLGQALKTQEVKPTFIDMSTWILLGLFSAFATFALCEGVNAVTSARMPDMIEGALITTGAYNHKKVIDWLSARLEKMFGSSSSEGIH